MRTDLPSGTVTFLFTDIEGSTRLLHELGQEDYARMLAEHRMVLRNAFLSRGGVEVDTQGDAFFVAFPLASEALEAAAEAQRVLSAGPIRVRMGVHTGTPHLTEEGYVGPDVHKGARIAAAGHGGQVLLSKATLELAPAEVTDLGEHRLKDFDEPVWIYQLGDERFPPLKTISNTNLPRPASSFVGREREVTEIVSLFQGGARLLTLSGPGGSGKTRLAIEAATELVAAFRNGVFWVGLAALRDPALVTETIGQMLGAKDGLAAHIGDREMLLLLDNFEQVVGAAAELSTLLEACPGLRLLVTSRELLRVRGEVEYQVPPLAEPEAVELFCARSGLGSDVTVAELCRRLDSLPLAVELAAARTNLLSPAQILERLSKRLDLLKGGRDTEARQRTLRATIEWSHELLDEEERRLFARLSVFRGGCTLEAAEDVAEADLDVLQSLVEKSLVRHTQERFWMLETIREYAIERLGSSTEAEQRRRHHADRFLELAEEFARAEEEDPGLAGSPTEWLDRLERDHDNLRAALDRIESSGDTQQALRFVAALWRFWYWRGHFVEGARRLEGTLRADPHPTAARAKALRGATAIAVERGDYQAARTWSEEAIALHRELGDAWGATHSVFLRGVLGREEGDLVTARPLLEESLQAFRDLGDQHYTLLATLQLAWMYDETGDAERARPLYEDDLHQARAAGDKRIVAAALDGLAMDDLRNGKIDDGLAMLVESLRIHLEVGNPAETADGLSYFARALAAQGRLELAARLLARSLALYQELGASVPSSVARRNGETLAAIRAHLDDIALAEAQEQGQRLSLDEAVQLALNSAE